MTEQELLSKFEDTKWHSARELKCKLSLLDSLAKKGLLEKHYKRQTFINPRVNIVFRKIK